MTKEFSGKEKITAHLEGQQCPMCNKKTLALTESGMNIPFFGEVFIFTMTCSNCRYHKTDVEAVEQKDPCRYIFDVDKKEDLAVRIVKSSEAVVKIPYIGSIEPGPASEGYITNVEGILTRMKQQIELLRDSEEDDDAKRKAKNLLKKIQRVFWGDEKIRITIEDPTGNSAIISDKAVKGKL